jgi:hypothetical protein
MNVPASRRDADVSSTSKAQARYPQKNGGAVSKKKGDATFTPWRLCFTLRAIWHRTLLACGASKRCAKRPFGGSSVAKVKIRTAAEREQAGKSLREKCPRLSHGKVILGQGKRDIVAMIKASNEGRLENLIPIRHGRMLQSPFACFRGTALIQAHDLKSTPASGINVHSCGDCHLMNFGGFATPERNLVFDINDFDETRPAPFEWDVKRLAASFVIAARWRGFRRSQARDMAVQAVSAYRESMNKRAGKGVFEGWYSTSSKRLPPRSGPPGSLIRYNLLSCLPPWRT